MCRSSIHDPYYQFHTTVLIDYCIIVDSTGMYGMEVDEETGYFGQQQVPLTDEIREILEDYSDGQIFKVGHCTLEKIHA